MEEAYLTHVHDDAILALQTQFTYLLDFAGSRISNVLFPYYSPGHSTPDDYDSPGGRSPLPAHNNNTADENIPLAAYFIGLTNHTLSAEI